MTQLFSNNADTTLAASLSDVATSATITDGSMLQAPTGGDFELLTLAAAGNYEIIKVTARTGNTLGTIARAQEGTTAQSWPIGTRVFAGITAGSLGDFLRNESQTATALAVFNATAEHVDAVAIGDSCLAETRSVAAGHDAWAQGIESVAFGFDTFANDYGVVIGTQAWVTGSYSVSLGPFATCAADDSVSILGLVLAAGTSSVAIGKSARTYNQRSIGIGHQGQAYADRAIAIGDDARAGSSNMSASNGGDAIRSIVLGSVYAQTPNTFLVGALPAVPKNNRFSSDADAVWKLSGAQAVVTSQPVSLTAVSDKTITIPTGVTFFPEEVGVIVTDADTVTVQPTVRFGITGDETKYLAATATSGLGAVHDRHRFPSLSSDAGAKTLRMEITLAGTATTLRGRFYWKGFAVVDT